MKNVTFMDKNSPKFVNKGPLGAKNRIRASKFYENTFGLFSSKELKGFRRQQKVQQIDLFDSLKDDERTEFLDKLYSNPKSSLNLQEGFGLRQKGWTLDRILTRNRDVDYARTHIGIEKAGKRYETVLKQPRLTVKNLQTFLQADRIAGEPEIINTLKTKSQLQDLGYEVYENAKPVVVKNDLGYYDISSCKQTNTADFISDHNLNEFELDVVKDNKTGELLDNLSKKLKIKFTYIENQQPVLKYAGKRRFFVNLAYKTRRFFARINTGIRAPLKNAIIFTNADLKTTEDVASVIDRIASVVVAENYARYEKFIDKDGQAKTRFMDNKNAMMPINKSLLAELVCRMGILSKHDANILSKRFKLNAIRAMHLIEDNSGAILSDIAELHSVCMRQIANAFDVNLKDFADISDIEFNENTDKTLDAVLSKPGYINPEMCLVKPSAQQLMNNDVSETLNEEQNDNVWQKS